MTAAEPAGDGGLPPGPAGPRRRRLEPDERRRQILTCAVRLFGERPYADVSITDVARAAGVARGLVNHYFGTRKGLYVEVVRALVTMPSFAADALDAGTMAERVDAAATWFLDTVSRHSRPWLVAVSGGAGVHDEDVAAVLAEADEVTADTLLRVVGLDPPPGPTRDRLRAALRAYSGFGKAAAVEWLSHGALERAEVHRMLTTTLLVLVREVFPGLEAPVGAAASASRTPAAGPVRRNHSRP